VDQYLQHLTYWEDITAPGGVIIESYRSVHFNLLAHSLISVPSVTIDVPGWAPNGTYELVANVGYYPVVAATDGFSFTKGEAVPEGALIDKWNHDEVVFSAGEYDDPKEIPIDFHVSVPIPNPFNPNTSFSVMLPESSDLSVVIYNINGQQVDELANGHYLAGVQHFIFDASRLASGLYFIRATVPGHMDAVQKVMLLR